jgi:hypothetical protein
VMGMRSSRPAVRDSLNSAVNDDERDQGGLDE